MWLSRILALLTIAALAAFGAGALGVSTYRDPALTEAGAGRAAGESRALAAEVAAALGQQRRAAEAALRAPELVAALASISADMAPHVRAALLEPVAQKLAAAHRPYNFVLVDPAGQLAGASAADFANGWSITLEELDRLADGKPLKTPRTELWAITLPLPWALAPDPKAPAGRPGEAATPPANGRLVILGPQPAELALGLFQETRSTNTLVMLDVARAVGPGADGALAKAVTGIFPGKISPVEAGGTPWQAMRTLVPGVHEFYVVVAWPAPAAPDFAQLGGVVGIFKRVALGSPVTQLLFGAGLLLWLLSVVASSVALSGLGKRLKGVVADGQVAFPQPASKWPGWLRPAIEALNETIGDLARRATVDKPVHSSVAPPTRPVQALAPAVSAPTVAPAEASAEKSVERSAEKSSEKSSEKSTEASTERSTEKSTEKSTDKPRDKGKPAARPALPTAETTRTKPKLPALDRDDPEPETQTDIELRPASVGPGLLDKLREERALPSGARGPGKHENTAVRPVPAELLSAMREEASRDTGVSLAPQALTAEEEAYFESVWKEFAATKHGCGEPVEPSDFRKFRAKLIRTRAQLVEKFKCRDVRFRVYVKEGKAALKASPVLEEDAEDAET